MPLYAVTGALNVIVNDTSVSRGLYTTSGAIRVSIVPGTSYTGLYAPDGSLNVVIDSLGVGRYHPCGALRGVTQNSLTAYTGLYSGTGATNMYGLLTGSELLLFNDWAGLSLDFIDNTVTMKTALGSETLTGITPNLIEGNVIGMDFTDNTYSMRVA
jgi:hypothetical protein